MVPHSGTCLTSIFEVFDVNVYIALYGIYGPYTQGRPISVKSELRRHNILTGTLIKNPATLSDALSRSGASHAVRFGWVEGPRKRARRLLGPWDHSREGTTPKAETPVVPACLFTCA